MAVGTGPVQAVELFSRLFQALRQCGTSCSFSWS
jgi:hypothetical protein